MRRNPSGGAIRSASFRLTIQTLATGLAISAVLMLTPSLASAAPTPHNDGDKPGTAQAADFKFGAPRGSVGLKVGWLVPRAGSDIFAFNAELLTLDLNSFRTPLFGIDVGIAVNNRMDVVFGFLFSRSSPVSEFRDFVDEFGAPIAQRTELTQVPLTASLKVYLTSRGRAVGSYAWVPASVVPYVGAGAGFTYWRYQQFGDFVDFVDFTIFELLEVDEVLLNTGWAPSLHAFGGIDVSVTPSIAINFEGRYDWAEGQMAPPAFVGFEPIDLAGFRGMFGVSFRF